MTNRRGRALWWRLLLAVSVVVAPVAVSGTAVAATPWRVHPAPLQPQVHLSHPALTASSRLSELGQTSLPRHPGPVLADTVVGLAAVEWCLLAMSRRRARHVAGIDGGRGDSARAPPERTSCVPFGPQPGRAGLLARSVRARFVRPGSTTCRRPV